MEETVKEPKKIELTKEGFSIVSDILGNATFNDMMEYKTNVSFKGIGRTMILGGHNYAHPRHFVALQKGFEYGHARDLEKAIELERKPSRTEIRLIHRGDKLIAQTRTAEYEVPLVDKEKEEYTSGRGGKYFHEETLYNVLREAGDPFIKHLDNPETWTSMGGSTAAELGKEEHSWIANCSKTILGHPTLLAYSLGLNNGPEAEYTGERRAHLDMFEDRRWDISDNEIDLAIMSAAVFGGKTTKELRTIYNRLEDSLRDGNFNNESKRIFEESTTTPVSKVPERFQLFQDKLFKEVREADFHLYEAPKDTDSWVTKLMED